LIVYTDNASYDVLDSVEFIIFDYDAEEAAVDTWGFVIGVGVMFVMVIIGIIMASKTRHTSVAVMTFSFVALVGLGINVHYELWDIWIAFLCALIIIGMIVLSLKRVIK
jgi:hydrogenase/urease accessory protein HupE